MPLSCGPSASTTSVTSTRSVPEHPAQSLFKWRHAERSDDTFESGRRAVQTLHLVGPDESRIDADLQFAAGDLPNEVQDFAQRSRSARADVVDAADRRRRLEQPH